MNAEKKPTMSWICIQSMRYISEMLKTFFSETSWIPHKNTHINQMISINSILP